MRQSEMDLLLAKGEYEVRTYFLCGSSARTNSIDGTTLYLTNKRIVLEFMNNFELARREIPIDQVLFFKSHYYEEQEDPSYAQKCKNWGITSLVFAGVLLVLGVLGLINVFSVFALFGLTQMFWSFIPVGIGLGLGILGACLLNKAKKYWPRIGKKLELIIGTSLDFDKGELPFSTDSTRNLRDNMRTYGGTQYNSLIGRVELSPTREAKRMINEIGALLIDIKAGLYDEDPLIKEKREREAREKEEKAKEAAALAAINTDKGKEEIAKSDKRVETQEERERREKRERREAREARENRDRDKDARIIPTVDKKKEKEEKMAKYGAPIEEDVPSNSGMPRAMERQFEKSKMKPPVKPQIAKSEDELLEEEYMSVIQSLNLD